ncbi:MAG: GNAT family N-acetyltransferase [Salinarimonadaceae bacterium]|nr:MAG: GNAT family N-acetyltransferase [Salinarimonadaceae bacterium]
MRPPAILRPYSPDDAPACLAIWRRASEAGHPFLTSEDLDADAALVRDVYLPAAAITVAEFAGRPAGFVALLDRLIGGLFVDPDHHRRGIGAALVASLGDAALDVEVYARNNPARAFYAAQGFRETSCRLVDDRGRDEPLVCMTRAARA